MKYLIVGRSGVGKDYISQMLVDNGLRAVKSYSTRPKRTKNEDTHIFITKEEAHTFNDKVAKTIINGYEYFATASQVKESDIYIIDPKGLYELINNMPEEEFTILYITVKNKELHRRMAINRGSDKDKEAEIFDSRFLDENKQFTEFENKLHIFEANYYEIINHKYTSPFNSNIKNIIIIENDYNKNTIETIVNNIIKGEYNVRL